MAEKKKKKETNSSCLMPVQRVVTLAEHISAVIAASDMMKRSPRSESPSESSMKNPPRVPPPKTQRASLCIVPPSVSEPPDSHLQKTPSEPLRETDSTASSVSVKSESSMFEPPSFNLQRGQSEPLRETDSSASTVSVKSESSMFEPPYFHLQRGQSEPLRETDSTASSVSMRSDSSMYEPPSFNLKRKQSQLTEELSSCSLCEEAMKDPVRLLCGHWSCKQCVLSFWDQYGSTADYSCKKCGRRFKGEPEHHTDSEDDKKNLKLPSASRPAPQNTTGPVGRQTRDPDLQSVLLEKTIKRVEMETEKLQAEKETFQAEKETFQAEKEKFQAEKEKVELEKRKLALEIQSMEQRGSYNPYVPYNFPRTLNLA